jgi:16S rRNA (guanine1207-N2)-methyltransferase
VAEEWGSPPEPDHYFSERPKVASHRRELHFLYRGTRLTFVVDRGVFASTSIDPGTSLLIETLDPVPTDRILDLGCGWGAIGVAAARAAPHGHVVLTDVNRRAALLARANLRRNRIENAEVRIGSGFAPVADEKFELIATNPPYHAGRELVLTLLKEAPGHLASNGRLLLVGKGSQGIRFYQRWLSEHWAPDVEVRARGGGYRVLEARVARTVHGPKVVRETKPSDPSGETAPAESPRRSS